MLFANKQIQKKIKQKIVVSKNDAPASLMVNFIDVNKN